MHAVGREDPEPNQPRPCGGPHVFRMGYGHSRRGRWVHGPPIRNTCGPPHGRGWLGSGSSRPTACTPGLHTQHAAPGTSRGGLCRRGCPTKPYFSRRPRGGPHIFYMADELILERFGLRHTNTWGTHHVIWLTNECTFPKVDRWGRIYFARWKNSGGPRKHFFSRRKHSGKHLIKALI